MEYDKKDHHLQPEFDVVWDVLWDYQDEILNNKSDYSLEERDAKWASICEAMARITESLCDGEGCGYE